MHKILIILMFITTILFNFTVLLASTDEINNLNVIYKDFYEKSEYKEALEVAQKALVIAEGKYGKSSIESAEINDKIGDAFLRQDNNVEAEKSYNNAMNIREKISGTETALYAQSLFNLGRLYFFQDNIVTGEIYVRKALDLQMKLLNPNDSTIAESLNLIGVIKGKNKNYLEAERFYSKSIDIYKKNVNVNCFKLIKPIRNLAKLYQEQGKNNLAEKYFLENIEICKKNLGEDHPRTLDVTEDYITYLDFLGLYSKSQPFHENLVIMSEKVKGKDHPETLTRLHDLCLTKINLGNYTGIENELKNIIEIKEKSLDENDRDLGAAFNTLGVLYMNQANIIEAESYFLRSIKYTEKIDGIDYLDLWYPLNNLAAIYMNQGKLTEAEEVLHRTLKIIEKSFEKSDVDYALPYSNLALLYSMKEKYIEAEFFANKAIKIYKNINSFHPNLSHFLKVLAIILYKQNRLSKAEKFFKESIDLSEKTISKNHINLAINYYYLANICTINNNFESAEIYLKKSIEICENTLGKDNKSSIMSMAMAALGRVCIFKNKYDDAEKYCEISIKISNNNLAFDDTLLTLALAYLGQNKFKTFLKEIEQIIFYLENRIEISGTDDYSTLFRRQQNFYINLLLVSLNLMNDEIAKPKVINNSESIQKIDLLKYYENCFKMLEIIRSRIILEQISFKMAIELAEISVDDKSRVLELDSKIKLLENNFDSKINKYLPEEFISLDRQILDLKVLKKQMELEYSKKYPKYLEIRKPKIADVYETQINILKDNELLISYFETKDYLYACLVTKKQYKFLSRPLKSNKTRFKIDKINKIISEKLDFDIFKDASYLLYMEIFEPFIKEIDLSGIDSICLVTNGTLSNIPFEILVTSQNGNNYKELDYLFKNYNIAYSPSATVLKQIRKHTYTGNNLELPVILFGDPLYSMDQIIIEGYNPNGKRCLELNEGFKDALSFNIIDDHKEKVITRSIQINGNNNVFLAPLPNTKHEVEFISNLFYNNKDNKNLYLGPQALESKVKELSHNKELSKYKYLHFACHGILSGEVKGLAESCLALSIYGDSGEDGLLKMSEIFGLKLNADMVTLSACQTGIESDSTISQGISELARAFFFAGTPRLTVTLWNISDEGTSEFMKRYYKNLIDKEKNKTSFIKALNDTRLQMLETKVYCHPYYWAPFIMIGDWL